MESQLKRLGVVVSVSQEVLDMYREDLMTTIRLAPVRRARRLAEETYWQNDETLDNPCVVRGDN